MGDLFGLGGIASEAKTAIEAIAITIVLIILGIAVALIALKHKSGTAFLLAGIGALVASIIIFGPLVPYLQGHIHATVPK